MSLGVLSNWGGCPVHSAVHIGVGVLCDVKCEIGVGVLWVGVLCVSCVNIKLGWVSCVNLIEYRVNSTQNASSGVENMGYDDGIFSNGLAVWHLQTADNGLPVTVTPGVSGVANSIDYFNYMLVPDNFDIAQGQKRLWNTSDTFISGLKWGNREDTRLVLAIGDELSRNRSRIEIEWAYGAPLKPRLDDFDSVQPAKSTYLHADILSVAGLFGVKQFDRVLVLKKDDVSVEIDVDSWSCHSIDFTIPYGLESGTYDLQVKSSADSAPYGISEKVKVENSIPVVGITSPMSGDSFFTNSIIDLLGTSSDRGRHLIGNTDGSLEANQVTWYVDNTVIGTGHSSSLNVTSLALTAGTHTIRFEGNDGSAIGEDSVSITILEPEPEVNNAPIASITSHQDNEQSLGTIVNGNDRIAQVTFKGTGNDAEDGVLPSSSLSWAIKNSGGTVLATNTGSEILGLLSGSCAGIKYLIELTATDSKGKTATKEISHTVFILC